MATPTESPQERLLRKFPLLEISAKGAAVLDPMSWDALPVELPRGAYIVQIFCVQYPQETHPRISRVHISADGSGTVGSEIGTISVDGATLGIIDARALDPELEIDQAAIESSWQSAELVGFVQWGEADDDVMVYMNTGFGDGTYEVNEILNEEGRVGFEIQFIEPNAPYPFA